MGVGWGWPGLPRIPLLGEKLACTSDWGMCSEAAPTLRQDPECPGAGTPGRRRGLPSPASCQPGNFASPGLGRS